MLPKLTLVLGGAASGKSAYAEGLVMQAAPSRLYLATAQAWDDEMRAKLSTHRARRDATWATHDCPIDPAPALALARAGQAVLLDCATMWLSNLMLADHDIDAATEALLAALSCCPAPVVVVSNEVGLSVVPDNALARRFANAQGRLNQQIAARADRVIAVMAGLPLALKGPLT